MRDGSIGPVLAPSRRDIDRLVFFRCISVRNPISRVRCPHPHPLLERGDLVIRELSSRRHAQRRVGVANRSHQETRIGLSRNDRWPRVPARGPATPVVEAEPGLLLRASVTFATALHENRPYGPLEKLYASVVRLCSSDRSGDSEPAARQDSERRPVSHASIVIVGIDEFQRPETPTLRVSAISLLRTTGWRTHGIDGGADRRMKRFLERALRSGSRPVGMPPGRRGRFRKAEELRSARAFETYRELSQIAGAEPLRRRPGRDDVAPSARLPAPVDHVRPGTFAGSTLERIPPMERKEWASFAENRGGIMYGMVNQAIVSFIKDHHGDEVATQVLEKWGPTASTS